MLSNHKLLHVIGQSIHCIQPVVGHHQIFVSIQIDEKTWQLSIYPGILSTKRTEYLQVSHRGIKSLLLSEVKPRTILDITMQLEKSFTKAFRIAPEMAGRQICFGSKGIVSLANIRPRLGGSQFRCSLKPGATILL